VEMGGSREKGVGRLKDACRSSAGMAVEDAVPSIAKILCCDTEPEDDVILLGVDV
jgi:hypothetical protein